MTQATGGKPATPTEALATTPPARADSPHGESYSDIVWRQFKKNKAAYVSLWLVAPLFVLAVFAPMIASDQPLVFVDYNAALLAGGRAQARLELSEEAPPGAPPVRSVTVIIEPRPGANVKTFGETATLALTVDGEEETFDLARQRSEQAQAANQPRFASGDARLFRLLEDRRESAAVISVLADGAAWSGTFGQTVFPWWRRLFNPEETVDLVFNMALLATVPWLLVCLVAGLVGRRKVKSRRGAAYLVGGYFVVVAILSVVMSDFAAGRIAGYQGPPLKPKNTFFGRSFAEEELRLPHRKYGWYAPIPFGPTQQDVRSLLEPPGYQRPRTITVKLDAGRVEEQTQWQRSTDGFCRLLGTDDVGRDVLTRLLYGTRISLTVGFFAVGLYITIGVIVGAIAGYFGGLTDLAISRVIEVVLLFPSFFLILTLVALIGPSIYIVMFVIGVTGWPTIARLIRGEVLKQRANDYTAAARALGVSDRAIIFRHILPNALSPALVAAPFGIAGAIITEAGLSLLGFGVQPPAPSWGAILQAGETNYSNWWLIVVPSLAIFYTVTTFNLIGSGLRDAMDPRLRK